jgi:hypothetical protein
MFQTAYSGGIDGATAWLAGAVQPGGAHWRVPHTTTGLAQVVARVDRLQPTLVVLEARGG